VHARMGVGWTSEPIRPEATLALHTLGQFVPSEQVWGIFVGHATRSVTSLGIKGRNGTARHAAVSTGLPRRF
jgi:hypothetical protein